MEGGRGGKERVGGRRGRWREEEEGKGEDGEKWRGKEGREGER